MPEITSKQRDELLRAAREVMQKAHAPYSKFFVGAAVLTQSGNVYMGCNVENASYGLTICAERNAIFAAVAAEGGPKTKLRAVAVVNATGAACSPCGACRQVIFEFGPDAMIFFQGSKGVESARASELLPAGFTLL